MEISSIVFWVVIAILIFWVVHMYNSLVSLKHNVSKNLSNIDVLLKQRNDELPKLVATCQEYMTHEQNTLQAITEARTSVASAQKSGDVKALGKAESALRMGLGNLFAVAENYPELKADKSFAQLQSRISGLENGIADRRELYNESVNINNVRIEQFPDVLIARAFAFKAFDLLEFDANEIADVNMGELFARSN